MREMKFLNLYLLSQRERRGLKVPFPSSQTVVQSGNGYGKSAVLKSLYDTLGASPHKVDSDWRRAGVTQLVEFSVDDVGYFALKHGDTHSVFDGNGQRLIATSSITSELAPFLAKILNFKLTMPNKEDEIIVPPPAYMFAPFYVDQDHGWVQPWSSFKGMFLSDSKRTLFNYHLGLRPNEYYDAKGARDRLADQLERAKLERLAFTDSIARLTALSADVVLNFSMEGFESDTDRLVKESNELHKLQRSFLDRLSKLNEERLLWAEQKEILETALGEMDEAFATAVALPAEVECPTCGQHYDNSVVAQFDLVKDKDDILRGILGASQKLHDVQAEIDDHRKKLIEIRQSIERIRQIFSVKQSEISLGDIISSQGRDEALRLLRRQLDELDSRIGKLMADLDTAKSRMERILNHKRSREIMDFYANRMAGYSRLLDVRVPDDKQLRRPTVQLARGSEGTRAISAYYYACLATIEKYGSSTFCPVVIDAPNQQGQDKRHMPALMKFLLERAPKGRQIIIATEELFGIDHAEVDVIEVGISKNQVLDANMYEEVSDVIRPFLGQLL